MHVDSRSGYWRANVRSVAVLLTLWLGASFGAGILLADRLDALSVAGFPVGFWFATEGAIIAFVALVVAYVAWMNALDRRHGVYER